MAKSFQNENGPLRDYCASIKHFDRDPSGWADFTKIGGQLRSDGCQLALYPWASCTVHFASAVMPTRYILESSSSDSRQIVGVPILCSRPSLTHGHGHAIVGDGGIRFGGTAWPSMHQNSTAIRLKTLRPGLPQLCIDCSSLP